MAPYAATLQINVGPSLSRPLTASVSVTRQGSALRGADWTGLLLLNQRKTKRKNAKALVRELVSVDALATRASNTAHILGLSTCVNE